MSSASRRSCFGRPRGRAATGVGRIARGQRLSDRQAPAIGGQRLRPVPLDHQHVLDLVLADREVALRLCVGRIARGKRLGDGQAPAIGGQRSRPVPWATSTSPIRCETWTLSLNQADILVERNKDQPQPGKQPWAPESFGETTSLPFDTWKVTLSETMSACRLPKKLKKEPLVDAIFEIRFSSKIPASSVLPGLFDPLMLAERNVERLPVADVPISLRHADSNLRYAPVVRLGLDKFFLLISDFGVALACKMPYVGWDAFKAKILEVMLLLKSKNVVESLERYSFKYVDLIEGANLRDLISQIAIGIEIGRHPIKSEPFSLRVEMLRDDLLHIVQVIAPVSLMTPSGQRNGAIVDIDVICNNVIPDFSVFENHLPGALEVIHQAAKQMFFDCLMPETITRLEPVYD